jgi:hypothetical protein
MVEIQCDTCVSDWNRYSVSGDSNEKGFLTVEVIGCTACSQYILECGCNHYEKKPKKIYVGIYDQRGYRQIGYIKSSPTDGCDIALLALNDEGMKEVTEKGWQ